MNVLVAPLQKTRTLKRELQLKVDLRWLLKKLGAESVTGIVTVVQFCQPPVAGIDTTLQELLTPLKPTCIDAPPGDATRSCTE